MKKYLSIFFLDINERSEDIKSLIVQVKDVISQPITIGHPEDADEQLATLNVCL